MKQVDLLTNRYEKLDFLTVLDGIKIFCVELNINEEQKLRHLLRRAMERAYMDGVSWGKDWR